VLCAVVCACACVRLITGRYTVVNSWRNRCVYVVKVRTRCLRLADEPDSWNGLIEFYRRNLSISHPSVSLFADHRVHYRRLQGYYLRTVSSPVEPYTRETVPSFLNRPSKRDRRALFYPPRRHLIRIHTHIYIYIYLHVRLRFQRFVQLYASCGRQRFIVRWQEIFKDRRR